MSSEDLQHFRSNYDNILVYSSDWFEMISSYCLALKTNEWQSTQDKTEGLDKYIGKATKINPEDLAEADQVFKNMLTYTPVIKWDQVYDTADLHVDSWFAEQKSKQQTILNYNELVDYYKTNINTTWQIGNWKCKEGKLQYPGSQLVKAIQPY